MATLRPLFGLTCIDEAMPGANDKEVSAAMTEAEALMRAMEKAPVHDVTADNKLDSKPKPTPAPAPEPAMSGPRRR